MLRWWGGDRLRYFYGKSERKNTCRESRISMFFLKLFVIGRDSPAEVGQHCFDNFFSHLETHAQSSPSVLPWLTSWRALKGWLYKHEWNGVKSVLYQVNYKRKWISPLCSLFPLFFFVSLPPVLEYPCGRTNARSKDWLSFFPFSLFCLLSRFVWAKCSPGLCTEVCCEDMGLVEVCCVN